MARLTARENRYFLWTEPSEVPRGQAIPGARALAGGQRFDLPRKPGVILALDRVFGADGWEPASDILQDVSEARGRVYEPAREGADISIEGAWLVVRCAISDKELVKRVPGYRWDPRRQRWFVPALPVALDLLREGFTDLRMAPDVESTIELRRMDQRRAEEQALRRTADAVTPRVQPMGEPETLASHVGAGLPGSTVQSQPPAAHTGQETAAGDSRMDALLERLDRLATAVEQLVERLEPATAGPGATPSAPEDRASEDVAALLSSPAAPGEDDWRDFLDRWEPDPGHGMQEAAERARQAASPSTWDAVAGILAFAAGHPDMARQHLRRAPGDPAVDPELQSIARATYTAASVALLAQALGAGEKVGTVPEFRAALAQEVVSGESFDPVALAGGQVRDVIATLVDDPLLRELSPTFADAIRVLDLLVGVRSDAPGIVDRLERLLVRDDASNEAFGLTIMLAAAHVAGAATSRDTIHAWPREDVPTGLRIEPGRALSRLQGLDDPTLRGEAARSALFLTAADASDNNGEGARRGLARLVHRSDPAYGHASFLAWFPIAARGGVLPEDRRDAYLAVLKQHPLHRTRDHIERMFAEGDAGDRRSIVRYVAEEAIAAAALAHGVQDPQSEVIDLLDLFETGDTATPLNALARAVEDRMLEGADRFSLEHRILLYERALQKAVGEHKKELASEALTRLTALLWECDRTDEVARVANTCLRGRFAPIRGRAVSTLAEAMAAQGQTAEQVLAHVREIIQGFREEDRRHALLEVAGLLPEVADAIRAELGQPAPVEAHPLQLDGHRLLLVGGHERLRRAVTPVLEGWGAKVDWLGPDEAKQGNRAVDLVNGACTEVVVNTSYIGHSASGRVIDAAGRVGKPVVFHSGNGALSMLTFLREQFGGRPVAAVTAPTEARGARAAARRKLAGL